jgi:hypothetical protein
LIKIRNDPNRSKSKNLWPVDEMQEYLRSNLITTKEKILLFSMRSRTNDLKWNYKEKYKQDLSCSLCKKYPLKSESHLLNSEELKMEKEISEEMNKIEYMDIYGIDWRIKAVKTWKKIFNLRIIKLEKRKLSSGHQVHQLSASCGYDSNQGVGSAADCVTTSSKEISWLVMLV